jgi:hypothetical protein
MKVVVERIVGPEMAFRLGGEHSLRVAGRAPDIVFEKEVEDLAGLKRSSEKLPITKPFNPTRQ